MYSANQLTLDGTGLFPLDYRRRILYTAPVSSFWTDRSLLRTQSYQRRGDLSPFPLSFLERISPTSLWCLQPALAIAVPAHCMSSVSGMGRPQKSRAG